MNKPMPKESKDVLETHLEYIRGDIEDIKKSLADLGSHYVTREEFKPVKAVVYGLVGLLLTGVMTAILGLVIIT